MTLKRAVVAFESEGSARERLESFGYARDVAAEIAVYLAQSTDLKQFTDEIARAFADIAVAAEFVLLDDLPARLLELASERDTTVVWALTDGLRYYRGSAVPGLARLQGFARFGSPATAAHLCQDKFASLALASAAGLAVPATRLLEGDVEITALGRWQDRQGPVFVKPNTLGAKIGIFADSLCETLGEATERSVRIWRRYRDRALVQPYVVGDDVRVSFMDLGESFSEQLGVERIIKDPSSETGGAFLTMRDNETLSGAKDTAGARGGFGQDKKAAFAPRLVDLREGSDAGSRRTVAAIVDASAKLQRVANLCDCFSLDFRIDADGKPTFLEFEVCPAVTIYDFQNYLAKRGLTLGSALAKAMRLAFKRRRAMLEA